MSSATALVGAAMALLSAVSVFALALSLRSSPTLLRPVGTSCTTRRSNSARCAATPAPAGLRLVLVDETERMRSVLHKYLSQRGFQCDSFASGADALTSLVQSPLPDVLITEVLTQDMDGLDLVRAVRADRRLCRLPVVLLTARGLSSDRLAGFEAGCSAYMSKPFDPVELVAVVRALASNAALSRSAMVDEEVHELRAEVASMRQLLQAVLMQTQQQQQQQGGPLASIPSESRPFQAPRTGPPPQLPVVGELAHLRMPARPPAVPLPKLTRREISVLELVGEGMLNKEIAAKLGVGLRYVEKVRSRNSSDAPSDQRSASASICRASASICRNSSDAQSGHQSTSASPACRVRVPRARAHVRVHVPLGHAAC